MSVLNDAPSPYIRVHISMPKNEYIMILSVPTDAPSLYIRERAHIYA